MTTTGTTAARKNRKRGSACAAVESRRRVVVDCAWTFLGRGGIVTSASTSPAAMDVAASAKKR